MEHMYICMNVCMHAYLPICVYLRYMHKYHKLASIHTGTYLRRRRYMKHTSHMICIPSYFFKRSVHNLLIILHVCIFNLDVCTKVPKGTILYILQTSTYGHLKCTPRLLAANNTSCSSGFDISENACVPITLPKCRNMYSKHFFLKPCACL